MTNSAKNCIAIDTNIFKHLFNKQVNTCNHIEFLLSKLYSSHCLLTDKKGTILNEYYHILGPLLLSTKNSDHQKLIKGWIHSHNRREVDVKEYQHKTLTPAIRKILITNDAADTTFICVAIIEDTTLITNDRSTIIDKGSQKNFRRKKLLKLAKKSPYCQNSFRILDSREACQSLLDNEASP